MAKRRKTDPDPTSDPPTTADTNGTTATEAPPGESPDGNGEAKRRPVVSFKCPSDRSTWLEVSVWENIVTPQDGEPYKQYVTTCQRSYKTGDGEWKANHSYRAHDLPVLGHLLAKAHAFATDKRVIEDVPF